jgi:hypothetical protein
MINSQWTLFSITCAIMIGVGCIGVALSDYWFLKTLHIINVIFGLLVSSYIIYKGD